MEKDKELLMKELACEKLRCEVQLTKLELAHSKAESRLLLVMLENVSKGRHDVSKLVVENK